MSGRVLGLAGIVVVAAAACQPDEAGALSAITNGSAANDRAVVALAGRRELCPQPAPGVTCSGVVIGPRLVITAAHCFAELFADGRGFDDLEVFAGADARIGAGEWRAVDAARLHPGYDPSTRTADLALALLDGELSDTTPVPLGTLPADGSAVGATVRLVGFGITESSIEPGIRRTGSATIASYDETTVHLSPSPSLSCAGDSGGAVLLDDGSGERLIAIIRSGDAGCVQFSAATRVDAYRAFIDPALDATDPLLGDGRLPPDPGADFCAVECATDLDCPDGMRCLDERVAQRCGYPAIRSGQFGAACASSADCGGSICAGVGAGTSHACRCLEACAADSTGEGGCSAGGSETGGTALILLALLGLSGRTASGHRGRVRTRSGLM